MTNKLPELGKIYRNIDNGRELKISSFGKKDVLFRYRDSLYEFRYEKETREKFSERFEELPNIKIQTNPLADIKMQGNSIWKPISELAEIIAIGNIIVSNSLVASLAFYNQQLKEWCYIENKQKCCVGNYEEFCTLGEFINQQEQLEARIERLEQLIKEK